VIAAVAHASRDAWSNGAPVGEDAGRTVSWVGDIIGVALQIAVHYLRPTFIINWFIILRWHIWVWRSQAADRRSLIWLELYLSMLNLLSLLIYKIIMLFQLAGQRFLLLKILTPWWYVAAICAFCMSRILLYFWKIQLAVIFIIQKCRLIQPWTAIIR
jgi:hypothetical protein